MKFEEALIALRKGNKIYPNRNKDSRYYYLNKDSKIVDKFGAIANLYLEICMGTEWEIYQEPMSMGKKLQHVVDLLRKMYAVTCCVDNHRALFCIKCEAKLALKKIDEA